MTNKGTQQNRRAPNARRARARSVHEDQLQEISLLVQRELIRGGVISGPMQRDWSLDDAYPRPPEPQPPGTSPQRAFALCTAFAPGEQPEPGVLTTASSAPVSDEDDGLTATREIVGRPALVLAAALEVEVQEALARSDSELKQLRELMRRYAEANEAAATFLTNSKQSVVLRLRALALSDRITKHGTKTASLEFAELVRVLDQIGRAAPEQARDARRLVESLSDHVLAQNPIYEQLRHGSYMHFLALLDDFGLGAHDIADVLDELPHRKRKRSSEPQDSAVIEAIHVVGVRVRRARTKLNLRQGTRSDFRRVPFEQRILMLLCRYVSPGERVSIDIRSGDGVPDGGGERSPLDPHGTPPQRAPRSSPADPPRGPGEVSQGRMRPRDSTSGHAQAASIRDTGGRGPAQPRKRGRTGTKSRRQRA